MPAPKRPALIAVVVILVLALILYLAASASPPPPTCGACIDDTPICDTATGQCVACAGDSECLSGTLCNESGACTPCRRPSVGCTGGYYCREDGSECVECSPGVNADCNGNPNGPICSTDATCIHCRGNEDCTNPQLPGYSVSTRYCDTVGNACVSCLAKAQCPNGQYCADGVCAACAPDDPGSCGSGYCVVGGDGVLACAPCVAGDVTKPCATPGNLCVPDGNGSSTCVECVSGGDPCSSGKTCQGGKCTLPCSNSNPCLDPDLANCIDGVCVGCSDGGSGAVSDDCAYPGTLFPYCESGLCVQCSVNGADQTGCDDPEAPHCYKNTCQQCSPDTGYEDCLGDDGGPFCQKVSPLNASDSYQCVGCVDGSSCTARTDGRTICDTTGAHPTYQCVGCDGENPCTGGKSCIGGQCAVCGVGTLCPSGDGTFCSDGRCVECAGVGDCAKSTSGQLCNQSGQCVRCLDDEECPGSGDSANLAHCRADGLACVECTGDLDCMTDPRRFCDPATKTCVACNDDHACPLNQKCVAGARCAYCTTNCDCGDIGQYYCQDGNCTRQDDFWEPCWSWKGWYFNLQSEAPTDDAMGGPNYLAVVGQEDVNGPWYFGRTPRSAAGYGGLPFRTMEGNKVGDTGSNYTKRFLPIAESLYYLAKHPGCGRPAQLTTDAPVMFYGTLWDDMINPIEVCATLSGEYGWSAPSANSGGVCGPPTGAGTFVKMGRTSILLDDCPPP